MFKLTVLIGIYSYSIFFLGLLGILNSFWIGIISLFYLSLLIFLGYKENINDKLSKIFKSAKALGNFEKLILLLIGIQVTINLLGVLGPELAFDSLWYHLTLPKIYLAEGRIFYIPGGLFYYSAMPKLIEMLYIPALLYGGETIAKLIHFIFGLGSLVVIYRLARKFVNVKYSQLACLIFYSNLVVAWVSITSYIDLGRTFFEIFALYLFVQYIETKKEKYLLHSAVTLGLAIATKLLSSFSIVIFVILLIITKKSLRECIIFIAICILIPLPWLVFSYINTGSPIFPFFTDVLKIPLTFNFSNILAFIHSPDPISPIYMIFVPLIVLYYRKLKQSERLIAIYVILAFIFWLLFQTIGGGRYLMAYLPAWSILCVIVLAYIKQKYLTNFLVILIVLIAVVTVVYRGVANYKYFKVLIGAESKAQFLTKNLNFSYGDFYDTDGYFKKHIKPTDKVLVFNIHNLYYADFAYVDSTYLKPGDFYNYILVRGELPKKFQSWHLVYSNAKTGVKLYKP